MSWSKMIEFIPPDPHHNQLAKLRLNVHYFLIAELHERREAPWLSKSTYPRKFGHHVIVHRPSVRPHHKETNVSSHTS